MTLYVLSANKDDTNHDWFLVSCLLLISVLCMSAHWAKQENDSITFFCGEKKVEFFMVELKTINVAIKIFFYWIENWKIVNKILQYYVSIFPSKIHYCTLEQNHTFCQKICKFAFFKTFTHVQNHFLNKNRIFNIAFFTKITFLKPFLDKNRIFNIVFFTKITFLKPFLDKNRIFKISFFTKITFQKPIFYKK